MAAETDDRSAQLLAIASNWHIASLIYAIAKLQIADHLVDGPKTVAELAEATGTHQQSLQRVLRALATMDIFRQNEANQFELTPLADRLREDSESSLRQLMLWRCSPMFWRPWGELLHTLTSGETAFNHVYGVELFEYLDQHPDDAVVFNNSMTRLTDQEGAAVAETYDFSGYRSLIDVGGGHGALMKAILARHVNLQGAIFDLPGVVQGTRERLASDGIAHRCQLIGGSFFEDVPSDFDAYILKDVIHDWDDERSLAILRNCRKAMRDDAHLLIAERVVPPGNDMHQAKWIDLTMMLITGGMERTGDEYRDLLAAAGFVIDRIVPTEVAHSVIQARPV